ncbi:MAG: M14 family metallopeptidase [Gammaproteobacteria bacterium]
MRTVLVSALSAFAICPLATAQNSPATPVLHTPLERATFTRISTSAEITAFLDEFVAHYRGIAFKAIVGKSVQGRAIEALEFRVEREGESQPATVLVIGSQHGAAEPAGGEALLVIARDLAGGVLSTLRDDIDIILIPNANPDGRDLVKRANANGVNINTDFVSLSQPESRVLEEALTRYRPDAVLDSHESAVLKRKTLAREGYLTDFNAQFEIANNPAVPAAVREFALNALLPELIARVSAAGLPAQRYVGEITSIKQPITHGGLTLRNFRNTAGISGAVSFLVETKLDSREDAYPTYRNIAVRLERQLLCIRTFLTLMHERRADLVAHTAAARNALHKEPLILNATYALDSAHPTLPIPMRRLDTRELEVLEFRDHRKVVMGEPIPYPPMLVVTRHIDKIRDVLDRHGLNYWSLTRPTSADVIAMRFDRANNSVQFAAASELRKLLEIDPGGMFIDLAQPNGRYAMLLLDPRSISSIFHAPEFASLVQPDEDFFIYRTFKGATRSPP